MTPQATVTLNVYARHLVSVLEGMNQPSILVAHSMGGIAASQASELAPALIEQLVYVAAFMPKDADTLLELAEADSSAEVFPHLTFAADGSRTYFDRDATADVFYNDCTPEDAAWATQRLTSQPTQPYLDRLQLTDSGHGSVRRTYLRTLMDRAVTPEFQAIMCERHPPDRVVDLASGHSPFLSRPRDLAQILVGI